MDTRIPLVNFVLLGQRLNHLENPQTANVHTYVAEIRGFIQSLTDCDLPRTRQAAEPLGNTGIIYADARGFINAAGIAYFNAMMATIRSVLYSEAGEKQVMAIRSGAVSQQLRDVPSTVTLNATQRNLLNETILCLEAGAYRAAIVFGWNLAYDFMRQRVFDNHLAPFNQALANLVGRNGNQLYDQITDYEDFFKGTPGERTVIDTYFAAHIIGEKLRDNLRQHLRRRHDYAHSTFAIPSSDQANAYIKDLMDIIMSPPFS
jgi:hypothetical protein